MPRVALEPLVTINGREEFFYEEIGPEEFDYPGTGFFDDEGNEINLKEWRMVDDSLEDEPDDEHGCHYRVARFVKR
jgi:hypothetical protein